MISTTNGMNITTKIVNGGGQEKSNPSEQKNTSKTLWIGVGVGLGMGIILSLCLVGLLLLRQRQRKQQHVVNQFSMDTSNKNKNEKQDPTNLMRRSSTSLLQEEGDQQEGFRTSTHTDISKSLFPPTQFLGILRNPVMKKKSQ